MFILLTGGKENQKQHFVVRLVIGFILLALFGVLIASIKSAMGTALNESPKPMNIYTAFVATGLLIAALVFYETYCSLSSRSEKVSKWWPVIVKSAMFAGAISLFFAVTLIRLLKHASRENKTQKYAIGLFSLWMILLTVFMLYLRI